MEAVEEMAAPPPPTSQSNIAKGKRTKRHRTHSPIPFTIMTPLTVSAASSEDSTTTEEEDTARCLILLAQGHFHEQRCIKDPATETVITKSTVMYTCKTCNRAFSSFQALGGHRASHKKPKNEKRSTMFSLDDEDFPSPRNRISSNNLSLQLNNFSATTAAFSSAATFKSPSPRIHECSYCGAEFNSGQALGGHMRRHRAGPVSPLSNRTPASIPVVELKSPKNVLSLDLNLPAPPEDENQRFGFAGLSSIRQQKSPEERQQLENEAASRLVLSTTTTPKLVDCHY